jgi:DNA-binding CsgD family transcriptional regulator
MAIVGRGAELEAVRRFLTEGSGPRALYLHGDAGIGKSTIWQQVLVEAGASGFRVVSSRPTEAEARLPFAGLVDLLGDLLDEVQPELPAPQQRALDLALLRTTAGDEPPEPLAISLAALGLLRAAAERRPVAIGIDDVPWLDHSTASVLEFVLRRLEDDPIVVIAAQRTTADQPGPPRLLAAFSPGRITDLPVEPLSSADIDRLLADALGTHFAPSTLNRLHRTSGGNPFYAVELGRALQRRQLTGVDESLPLPDSLSGLVRDRLDSLSPAATDVVVYASGLSQPTTAMLEAALGAETLGKGLAEAQDAGIAVADGDMVRFSHPLLAAETYAGLDPVERRALHRLLATVVTEQEEHARHLSIAAEGPDEEVAAALEQAATRARERGAPDAAAELAERAVGLTPPESASLHVRRVGAAYYLLLAGEPQRATHLLERALTEAPEGDPRAQILVRLGQAKSLEGDWPGAEDAFLRALADVRDDVPLRIEIELALAGLSFITGRHWDAGAEHAAEAMRLADERGDPRELAGTIGHYAAWLSVTGQTVPDELERRAADLEPWTGHLRAMDHPDFDFGNIALARGDARRYRAAHERLIARAEEVGDYSSLPFLVANLVPVDFADGNADAATGRLERAERLALATGQRTALAHVLMWRTMLLARLGRADDAWVAGREALRLVGETGWRAGERRVRSELALLELSRANPAGAGEVVDSTHSDIVHWLTVAKAEALVGLGRIDEADALVSELGRVPRIGWMDANRVEIQRARALVSAARGDLETATDLVAEASQEASRRDDRWELARTELVAGEIHRRSRRRARAREALSAAAQLFDDLGAELWAARARQELGRISAGREDDGGLTATQRQVAELAVEGMTNRQVADRLFMSVHTVEAHLSSIYRALDIGSRSELGPALRRLADTARDSSEGIRDSDASTVPET